MNISATYLPGQETTAEEIKLCCANIYESQWSRLLLGDSFHPGGLALTEELGQLLELGPDKRVLDVASGLGTSAFYLAERFGCHVTGVDYGRDAVRQARQQAAERSLSSLVDFEVGDAEQLPFPEGHFDAVICECAYCTFPDKETAASEFYRVLKPGGVAGMSDLVRNAPLPSELDTLLAWIACVADARPLSEYQALWQRAGLRIRFVETRDQALGQLIHDMRGRLVGAELLVKLKQLELPGADFEQARTIAIQAQTAVAERRLGYALMVAERPPAG